MKLLIASDIHGDSKRAEEIKAIWDEGSFDSLVLLGDILYHGPRNDLPPFYAPKKVIPVLSSLADHIIAVRGNCDAEVDQMVLPFPILDEEKTLEADGRRILIHHGHHEKDTTGFDVVMTGHTHVPVLEEKDGKVFLNPGSTTIPKEGSDPSYAIWADGKIKIISLDDGHVVKEWE
ncbi:MAG: phosphodiesterase [Candidatus Ornithospirochaeta sp.]